MKSTAEFLFDYAERFREHFDNDTIIAKLQGSSPEDRATAVMFSVYHLLFSGAIAEINVETMAGELATDLKSNTPLPGVVGERANEKDRLANCGAWQGWAFEGTPNIIGAMSFSIVVLFFFEGYCKIVIGEETLRSDLEKPKGKLGLEDVRRWLVAKAEVDAEKLKTVLFLQQYRNAWHNFGEYTGREIPPCKGVKLEKGKRLPVLNPPIREYMLGDLLDLFFEVNETYSAQS